MGAMAQEQWLRHNGTGTAHVVMLFPADTCSVGSFAKELIFQLVDSDHSHARLQTHQIFGHEWGP
jgi:hypothetical protein